MGEFDRRNANTATDCSISKQGGFALRLVDAAGHIVADSPLHVLWPDDGHLELGRQFFVQRGSVGLGKHITRVSRQHIKITRNANDGDFVMEDVSGEPGGAPMLCRLLWCRFCSHRRYAAHSERHMG